MVKKNVQEAEGLLQQAAVALSKEELLNQEKLSKEEELLQQVANAIK
ncbi:MAG: hypothetical protein IJ759_01920 [Bacteroidales bacterium]|nr:hypothetical protein [Bacteroidales bacterium]